MKFREHRGGLADSMTTLVEVEDLGALVRHCADLLRPYGFTFSPTDLIVSPYDPNPDTRIGWPRTLIVTIEGYGVMGFTDGPS